MEKEKGAGRGERNEKRGGKEINGGEGGREGVGMKSKQLHVDGGDSLLGASSNLSDT